MCICVCGRVCACACAFCVIEFVSVDEMMQIIVHVCLHMRVCASFVSFRVQLLEYVQGEKMCMLTICLSFVR